MKRLLFSLIALFIVAGYAFAQNEAYVEQLGASYGMGVSIYQQGTANKLNGPGTVPLSTIGAAKIVGATNQLVVYQQMGPSTFANTGWVNQAGDGTATNNGYLEQTQAWNDAHISQTAGHTNTFLVYQTDLTNPYDGRNRAVLVQSALTDNYALTVQQANGLGDNYYNVDQKAPLGSNKIDNSAINGIFGQSFVEGIYQKGFNRIDDVTFAGVWAVEDGMTAPTFQTATLGNNSLSVRQDGSNLYHVNVVAMDQKASTGDNIAAFWQEGCDLRAFVIQNGTANTVAGHQSGVSKLFSVNQQNPTGANIAVITQL